jgi:hypothetical protein
MSQIAQNGSRERSVSGVTGENGCKSQNAWISDQGGT